jgi:serine/threonine protein kinase
VLHRDIKPSNILLTAYGHPVLSDFGIASTISSIREDDSVGLSIPWSAPEVLLDETPGTISSEVWALGATVYSLLAGRSPFEIPGGANGSSDLMSRIARAKPQPIGRPDVPSSLEQLLKRTMSRRPEQRPASALEFVRELQLIETELGVPQTSVEIAMDDWALGTVSDLEDRTRMRALPAGTTAPRPGRRRRRPVPVGDYAPLGTVREASPPPSRLSHSRPNTPGTGIRMLTWVLVVTAVLVVGLGVSATLVLIRTAGDDGIPTVSDISAAQSDGSVEFSWEDPGLNDGDRYQIEMADSAPSIQSSSRFVVAARVGETVCISVRVNRDGKVGDASTEKCVDVTEG